MNRKEVGRWEERGGKVEEERKRGRVWAKLTCIWYNESPTRSVRVMLSCALEVSLSNTSERISWKNIEGKDGCLTFGEKVHISMLSMYFYTGCVLDKGKESS